MKARAPRAKSGPLMGLRPAGWTVCRISEPELVATAGKPSTIPMAPMSPQVSSTARAWRTVRRRPLQVNYDPGQGSNARTCLARSAAGRRKSRAPAALVSIGA